MKILVTGGAGFIGSHLIERLAKDGEAEIVALDNLARGRKETLKGLGNRIRFVEGDVRDRELLAEVMSGVTRVAHLAAQSNVLGAVTDLDYSFSTNVTGTFEVLRAARRAGVERIVFSSSREVYGEAAALPVSEDTPLRPKNAYGASKVSGELYCQVFRSQGLDTTVLRFANVYGPGDRDRVIPIFLDRSRRQQPLTIYGGEQILDFVWIGTVTEVLRESLLGGPVDGPVNVGSGKGVKLPDLARQIIEQTGSRSRIEVEPARSVETARFVADIGKAGKRFGITGPEDPLAWLPMLTRPRELVNV
jgi:nucleoside-diphosphate-sugar epimerase